MRPESPPDPGWARHRGKAVPSAPGARPDTCGERRGPGWGVLVACLLALALPQGEVAADIYKYVDPNGVIHLSDRPLGPGFKRIVRTWKGWVERPRSNAWQRALRERRARLGPLIDRVADRHRLDRALVHAVITAESAYDPGAVSRAGAVGLMQLMPETAARYGVRDRRDPGQNLQGGMRYLRDLLLRFRDLPLALAAYNAGETAVVQNGYRIPPYEETRTYVRRVLEFYRTLRSGRGRS